MKNKFSLVSIVILNYNGLAYLKKTIKPILSLNYPNYEVIIVDNGSTDRSIEYIKKFKKIILIENKNNLGYSKGKNIGAAITKGQFILSIDNDILVRDKNFLRNLVRIYTAKIGFIQIPLLDYKKNKTEYYGLHSSLYGINFHKPEINIDKILKLKKDLIEITGPTGGCFFCSKENWNKIGGFDESQMFNLDDCDIGPRSIILGYKNYLYTKTYFIHLGINKTKNSENYSNRFKTLFSGHARAILKNYQLINLIWAFPIFFIFNLLKAIRYSIKKKSVVVFFAFIFSIKFFIKNFKNTLKERKKIQAKRKKSDFYFLNIRPPRFD